MDEDENWIIKLWDKIPFTIYSTIHTLNPYAQTLLSLGSHPTPPSAFNPYYPLSQTAVACCVEVWHVSQSHFHRATIEISHVLKLLMYSSCQLAIISLYPSLPHLTHIIQGRSASTASLSLGPQAGHIAAYQSSSTPLCPCVPSWSARMPCTSPANLAFCFYPLFAMATFANILHYLLCFHFLIAYGITTFDHLPYKPHLPSLSRDISLLTLISLTVLGGEGT